MVCLIIFCLSSFAQNIKLFSPERTRSKLLYSKGTSFTDSHPPLIVGDTIFSYEYVSDTSAPTDQKAEYYFAGWHQGFCKNKTAYFIKRTYVVKTSVTNDLAPTIQTEPQAKKSFITIHGNVRYILNYRSYIDTPFSASDVYQHTIQTYLDVTVKDKYPVRVYLTSNFSNTPLLKNFTNLNFGFNSNEYSNKIKEQVVAWSLSELERKVSVSKLKDELSLKYQKLQQLNQWLKSPVNYQRIIEERERDYIQKMRPDAIGQTGLNSEEKNIPHPPVMSPLNVKSSDEITTLIPHLVISNTSKKIIGLRNEKPASVDSNKAVKKVSEEYADTQKEYDSLNRIVTKLTAQYEKESASFNHKRDSLMAILQNTRDIQSLKQQLIALDLPDSVLSKSNKRLLAVRSFNIGTVPMNYSELTIKNISITGVQAEYNPSYYYAIAAGTISYQYRNYFLNQHSLPRQYVTALRFGKGLVEGNHIIATWYTGKRYVYGIAQPVSVNGATAPTTHLAGFSVEARYQLNKNSFLTGEYAKSSIPYYSNSQDKNNTLASTFHFGDRSNEAYSIKLQSYIPATQTKLIANYRRLGNNFQSFSLFTNAATQNSWYIKLQQSFFKRKLTMDAGMRQNDFSNPYIAQQYNSKTVFKSIQATLRIRKLPIVSIGYFPSSQILKINETMYSEQLFYTLIGTLSHTYRTRSAMMNSSIIYTRFYNHAADSGFVYFNTKNISLSQSITYKNYSVQGSISVASNTYYNLYSVAGTTDYHVRSWLSIGGGLKYNKQTVFDKNLLGYSLKTRFLLPKLGSIDIFYEKGFIPGVHHDLVNNSSGWITYSKVF
ncbi:MAG TPA: hypothetical protein PKM63_17385 [Panacibacter sp.]|nr:hypothetical protein [Panacibacter sp.]HNP46070.1 hypothetical protein [Panacibacter sp.]